jgi:hypothetical protein
LFLIPENFMTTIVAAVTVTQTAYATQPPAALFAAIAYVITDNSGVTLPAGTLTGAETPPWTVTATGASGPKEATVTFTALDSTGATLGTPLTLTESGSGGIPSTFPAPTGGSITVS